MLTIDEKKGLALFPRFPLLNAFSLASLGNMSERYGTEAQENQKKVWAYLKQEGLRREDEIHLLPSKAPGMIVTPDPTPEVAGPHVVLGNAVITAKEGSVLSLFAADCYPIFLSSKSKKFLALIHGSLVAVKKGRIIEKTVRVIREQFGIKPPDLIVGIGPGIKKCCYHVDLLAMIFGQLVEVPTENIFVADVCTSCGRNTRGEPLFFSHHRAKVNKEEEKRFGAFVALQR